MINYPSRKEILPSKSASIRTNSIEHGPLKNFLCKDLTSEEMIKGRRVYV